MVVVVGLGECVGEVLEGSGGVGGWEGKVILSLCKLGAQVLRCVGGGQREGESNKRKIMREKERGGIDRREKGRESGSGGGATTEYKSQRQTNKQRKAGNKGG